MLSHFLQLLSFVLQFVIVLLDGTKQKEESHHYHGEKVIKKKVIKLMAAKVGQTNTKLQQARCKEQLWVWLLELPLVELLLKHRPIWTTTNPHSPKT